MKHNIIKTDNYLLVVDDSEIKEGDWFVDNIDNNISIEQSYKLSHIRISKLKTIIAHLPLNNSPILEGVDLLPPIEQEEDVEYIANKLTQHLTFPAERREGIILGYNKAREKYKYTEEDIARAVMFGRWGGTMKIDYDNFIQSLSQLKIPIGFECEMENKIAMDGHTIIGSEPKTTTTPEGHTQWVGKYIFN